MTDRPSAACREALAVLLDDPTEHSADQLRRARAHAARCPRCSAALDEPAGAQRILDGLTPNHPVSSRIIRVVLAVIAAAQLVVAIPWLVGASIVPDAQVAVAHLTRDGALGVAVGVLGLVVVWRPRYAVGALMVGCVIFVVQSLTMVFDEQANSVSLLFEITHLLVFAILGLIGILSSTTRISGPEVSRHPRTGRSV